MLRELPAMLLLLTSASGIRAQDPGQPQRTWQDVRLPGGNITMPKPRARVVPPYPQLSKDAPVDGIVDVEVVVNTSGSVVDTRVTKSVTALVDGSCVEAAGHWTFDPAASRYGPNGGSQPVFSLVLLRFTFAPPHENKAGTVSAQLTTVPDRESVPDSDKQTEGAIRTEGSPATPVPAGVQAPRVLRQVNPSYTDAAMRAKIQGTVQMAVVVLANGTVGVARVVKSLDSKFGLDQEALRVTRHWLFAPGTMDGKPVPVVVTVILAFRLH